MDGFGVSFSLHRCSELGLDPEKVLTMAIKELGFKRFRLMSYWNIHEQKPGNYDFTELDWQMDLVAKHGGKVSLCIGKRQPRWPECHMPDWAQKLNQPEWYAALYKYIEVVVKRYKSHPALASWQLENEALLKSFGYCPDGDYSHSRLQNEYKLVKKLDSKHPVVMTLSDSWGVPWRAPKPDLYAMSLYRYTMNKNGKYVASRHPAWFYRLRAKAINILKQRSVFIHELQTEPWFSKAIGDVPVNDQLDRMDPKTIRQIVQFAEDTNLQPVDLWGLEWWYWLKHTHHRPEAWDTIKTIVRAKR